MRVDGAATSIVPPMWLSPEDARSDFILAAAALVFGTLVFEFLLALPIYPRGTLSLWLTPVWVVLLMIVPPRFLAGYREQGLEAFGLGNERSGVADGLLLVAPIVAVGYIRGFSDGNVLGALLGRLRGIAAASAGLAQLDLLRLLLGIVLLGVAGVGTMLLFGLLVTRARDGFRATDMPLLEALRTYGLGAVGIGTVLGLLVSLGGAGPPTWAVLLDGLAMAAVVLLTDRLVTTGDRTSRMTVLAPAIVAVVAFILRGGGLFTQNLALSLYQGALAASVAIVLAVLLETRRAAWAAVPLVAATVWAPTCATLPVAPFVSLGC